MQPRLSRLIAILLLLAVGPPAACADDAALPAFPGAEGFGAFATGGRGGKVIHVTNLDADGPGSLQEACSATGPRIVIFDVSGVITPKRNGIYIEDGNITIAGQTAPGAGITIDGMLMCKPTKTKKDFQDVVVRFLRVRPTKMGEHAVEFTAVTRFVLDHLSASWGTDENMGMTLNRDMTIQWCAIEASAWTGGLEKYRVDDGPWYRGGGNVPHCYGMILGYIDRGNVTLHHNLWAHHNRRTPMCGVEPMDHRNNVIYNVKEGVIFHPPRFNKDRPDQKFRANIVGNYFKDGPSTPKTSKEQLPSKVGGGAWLVGESGGEIYCTGNYFSYPNRESGVYDVWTDKVPGVSVGKCDKVDKPWACPPVTTQSAEEAYRLVMAQVGCLPRDAHGKRTIEEVRTGTGEWGQHLPEGGLMAGLTPGKAPADADGDGMPDEWEKAHKLNPSDPADAGRTVPAGASPNDRHKGYTFIEFYINERADRLIAEAMEQAAKTPEPEGNKP